MNRTRCHNCLVTKISRRQSTEIFGELRQNLLKEIRNIEDLLALITAAKVDFWSLLIMSKWLTVEGLVDRVSILRSKGQRIDNLCHERPT